MSGLEASWLRTVPLFGGLDDAGLEIFARGATELRFPAGEVIYREGERAEHLFLIERGEILVQKLVQKLVHKHMHQHTQKQAQEDGRAHALATLARGDFFGEMSFIDMQPRSATVRAIGDVVLWRWPYGQMHAVYRSDPKAYLLVVMNIARELSRRLRRADEVIGGSR